jgi:uncharacterized protein
MTTEVALSLAPYAVLVVVGSIVSFVNSIAGGGSVISLPLLMMFGLTGAEANGTNRLGVLLGSAGSLHGFHRSRQLPLQLLPKVAVPGVMGSVIGTLCAIGMPDRIFKPVLAVIILWVTFLTLRHSMTRSAHAADDSMSNPMLRGGPLAFAAFTAVGFYGGFIQAGSGLIMIYLYSRFSNLDLIRINALKVANTFIFIGVSLALFAVMGKVHWGYAGALAAGNYVGGYAGSVFQMRQGEAWVRRFLAVTGLVLAGKLLFEAITAP